MNKLGIAFGGLLMIGALAAPVAFAHYDSGMTSAIPFYAPPAGINTDRVAGWYYTSTNVWVDVNGNPVDNPLDSTTCPADDPATPVNENGVCELVTGDIDPSLLDFATWGGLYDVEVGGLGDCSTTNALNEVRVDGSTIGGGVVPDGIHNDGGNSAVGHTYGHYDCASFETSGCDRYNAAKAEDLVSGTGVWVGAQCNWGVPVTNGQSAPLLDRVAQFVGDVNNCPLGGFYQSCVDAVQYFDDCIGIDLISQTQLASSVPPNCGGTTSVTIVCGAGAESTIDFGTGGGNNAIYPDAGYDAGGNLVLAGCDSVSTATAFPFTSVVVTIGGLPDVDPATTGWVA